MSPSTSDLKHPICVILSTCPQSDGERLAAQLVTERRAACVNVIPSITSIYWWKGKVERDAECLLLIKCPEPDVDSLIAALRQAHPYDVPEIVALPVAAGNPDYLQWVFESLQE